MLGKLVGFSALIAAFLLLLLLMTTTPATIGPLGILAVFILMYITALGVLTFLLFGGSRMVARLSVMVGARRPLQPVTLGRAYYFSSVLALAPVMLVGMQSVGEVGVYEVLLVVVFVVISCVYLVKRAP